MKCVATFSYHTRRWAFGCEHNADPKPRLASVSNREDGAYCTKDLMLQHPEHKNWFKYIGRLDDTLTQTLGEKTNPVSIELAIVRSMLSCPAITWLSAPPDTH